MATDVAVVGAGIVGLATAYTLQQRGATVTLYDAQPPGSGQSAGQSRIFRHAHDDPRLVRLAMRGRDLWRSWEDEFGVQLVSRDGAVALGPAVAQRLPILEGCGVAARAIGPEELTARQPLLAAYDGPAMVDEGGGSIRTRAAIEALAGALAGNLVTDHVIALRPTGSAVEVRTATRRAEHGHVVLSAGRDTAALAGGVGIDVPVEVAAHVRVTFRVAGSPPTSVATLQDGSDVFGETGVYAAAYPGNTHYAVGLSDTVDVTATDGPDGLAQLADRAAGYVSRALPGLDPTPVEYVHCWTTTLPWGEDGCAVWEDAGVSCVAGHNLFKQAPMLGWAVAESVLGGGLPEELRPAAELGRDG